MLIISNFAINKAIGGGTYVFREGFYTYGLMKSTTNFSLSDQITIRAIPIIKDLVDGAKQAYI